ncbi:MAG: ABC transporter ATP-binding protein [Candidatus Aminicenantes bacterium]|nr:ABC transporter ATP-binding protein [Candidatus Aminicenantes bacterium]
MIKLENISKSFGPIEAVKQVSFEIRRGTITIITGADGAGKSTIFKMMVGLTKNDSGAIYLKGEKIDKNYSKITRITGYMPERFSLYMDLSVEENMNFFADIHQVPKKKREERKTELLEKTGMSPFRGRRAGALSGGMKQKLALSTILLSAPEIIILDEPTTGVDPLSRIEFFNIIEELKAEGKTIVISTPYLDEAERGDYIIFLKDGGIIQEGAIGHLKRDFPAKLYRVLPRGSIFDELKRLESVPELKNAIYIRGKYLKYLRSGEKDHSHLIQAQSIAEEQPKLEDIYLYYERKQA